MSILIKDSHRMGLNLEELARMTEDLMFDPILAAELILGYTIPPHQVLRILKLWSAYFVIDDSGFSMGKTTTAAIVCALRSILFPNRKSLIISGTFRQSQLIFVNFDKWYRNKNTFFHHCVDTNMGKPRITHGTSVWEIYFKGGSLARALPPNFSDDSTGLRGERGNDGYFDEFTKFDMSSFTKTIIGRITEVNDHQDCPIRQNHIAAFSTPGYFSDPAYAFFEKIEQQVKKGNKNYAIFTCNYRHVPRRPKWKKFVDLKNIHTMQSTNPPGVVKSEVDGLWQKDSLSFYSAIEVNACRSLTDTLMQTRKDRRDVYVCGFDSARGGADDSKTGDDFSATVFRIPHDDQMRAQHVYTIRKNKIKSSEMALIIYNLHKVFNFDKIVFDPNGGGLFVADDLGKEKISVDGIDYELDMPLINHDDRRVISGIRCLIPFRRNDEYIEQIFKKSESDSILLNKVHTRLSGYISNRRIILAAEWNNWQNSGGKSNLKMKREWLNKMSGRMESSECIRAEMDLAVDQLISVDIMRNKEGTPFLDKWKMFKFWSSNKKDSAYGLLYAFCGTLIVQHRLFGKKKDNINDGLVIGHCTY